LIDTKIPKTALPYLNLTYLYMKKLSLTLFLALVITATAFAHSNDLMPSQNQRITTFLGNGTAPSFCQQLPMPNTSWSSSASPTFSWNSGTQNSLCDFAPSNFSSFFEQLSAGLSDHHFDPNALGNLQSFIDNLHLP